MTQHYGLYSSTKGGDTILKVGAPLQTRAYSAVGLGSSLTIDKAVANDGVYVQCPAEVGCFITIFSSNRVLCVELRLI